MTCRIDRVQTSAGVVLRISGRIAPDDLDVLRDLLARETGIVAVDLTHLLLVDRDAVRLLAAAEASGVALNNCPAYIREWVARERAHMNE